MSNNSHYAYSTAKGFVQSSMLIVSSLDRFQTPDDTSFILAFHNLVGFAVELYLKSFLLNAGLSESVLASRAMGHKLDVLLNAATEKGFPETKARELVDFVGPKHGSFEYRYIKEGASYEVRNLRWMFDKLSDLDTEVDVAIGASVAHNKQPGGRWGLSERVFEWRLPR